MPSGSGGAEAVEDLLQRLTSRFGGATAFSRAPARGMWKNEEGRGEADDVIVVETMTDELDAQFWSKLQGEFEARLGQREILVRASRSAGLKLARTANGSA